jgi:hypothetical protein
LPKKKEEIVVADRYFIPPLLSTLEGIKLANALSMLRF